MAGGRLSESLDRNPSMGARAAIKPRDASEPAKRHFVTGNGNNHPAEVQSSPLIATGRSRSLTLPSPSPPEDLAPQQTPLPAPSR